MYCCVYPVGESENVVPQHLLAYHHFPLSTLHFFFAGVHPIFKQNQNHIKLVLYPIISQCWSYFQYLSESNGDQSTFHHFPPLSTIFHHFPPFRWPFNHINHGNSWKFLEHPYHFPRFCWDLWVPLRSSCPASRRAGAEAGRCPGDDIGSVHVQ